MNPGSDALSTILGNLSILVHFRHLFIITLTVEPFYGTNTKGSGLNKLINHGKEYDR